MQYVDVQLEQERHIREKVYLVLNLEREDFKSTPEYNDFLEKREELIYQLCYEQDETKKKHIQDEITLYEANNQKIVLDCSQKRAKNLIEETKNIVAKEGLFFELVRDCRFWIVDDISKKNLIHTLQRRQPEIFQDSKINKQARNFSVMQKCPKPLQNGLIYSKLVRRVGGNRKNIYYASGLSKNSISSKLGLELWKGIAFNPKK